MRRVRRRGALAALLSPLRSDARGIDDAARAWIPGFRDGAAHELAPLDDDLDDGRAFGGMDRRGFGVREVDAALREHVRRAALRRERRIHGSDVP
mgnify:CR=1 FL=1